MRILAIDGAGPIAASACADGPGGLRVAASVERAGTADADLLPDHVRRCLEDAAWRIGELDLIACSVGPGGFTSIRTAVALARALALAAGLPVMAVSTFEALAATARRSGIVGPLRVVIAGGRGAWYVQDFADGRASAPPQILAASPGAVPGSSLVGAGCEGALPLVADARDVAEIALARVAGGERPCQGFSLVPLYLRGADAREGAGRSLFETARA